MNRAELDAVIAGLSKAQREAILFDSIPKSCAMSIATARVLFRRGLTENDGYCAALTPLGQQVRARLMEQANG